MKYTKEILVKDYFDIHNFYSEIYGYDRTIILIQIGSFHEIYATDDEGLNLNQLSIKLDIICTRKNNKSSILNEKITRNNPRMMGFPIYTTDNFIEKLCNLNYTVIRIDQITDAPKPKREITGIYSPATYIEKISSNINYLVSIVIEKNNNNYCIGLASYDLSTGYGSFYETYSKNHNDFMLAFDDANRYLETCPPKEIILYINKPDETKEILNYLNLDKNILYNYTTLKNNNKLPIQTALFNYIFENQPNIFDILNLHLYNYSRFALTNLFDYVKNHQLNLINKLKIPTEFINKNYLYLGNHCLEQLNVINKNITEKSLFQIINYTKTSLGKRYLYETLSKPLINSSTLNERYELINTIINNKHYNSLLSLLEDISDIDKFLRRLELETLQPQELYLLYLSFYQIDKLYNYCIINNLFIIDNKYNVTNILNYINETFNLDLINSLNFNNFNEYDKNIFKANKYNLNDIVEEITTSLNFFDELIIQLSLHIHDNKIFIKKNKNDDNNFITLKFNDREGYYLYITNRRCDILKNNLNKLKYIEINNYKLNISDIEFIKLPKSSYTKINCSKLKDISNDIIIKKIQLAKMIKYNFKLELQNILKQFNDIFIYWGKYIAYIDFINSGALLAINNHYTKPTIILTNESYFNAIQIRHPIVEYISNEYEYTPYNLSLGGTNDLNGILLYGINSSGKSTLMKSIGLNIILAQIGYFVAAENFTYSPYYSLFTRISSNDNIYKGHSAFMVEMLELTTILKRNNMNTLVLADEIASKTERKSGNIIVAYMLDTLSKSKTCFITATHLHELTNLQIVKSLTNVKSMHIKIQYDEINDKLIYDRQLTEGQGESFYGLQVAKYLMKDINFNNITNNILADFDNINIKQSKYNTENFLIFCNICKTKTNLETHHIIFQKNFDENNINSSMLHYQKDSNYNLVTLCKYCHDEVDRNKIIINGWKNTSEGRELVYYNNKPIKQHKYSLELIDFILNLKNTNIDEKMARIKIKEKFNKRLSLKTIKNIWNE